MKACFRVASVNLAGARSNFESHLAFFRFDILAFKVRVTYNDWDQAKMGGVHSTQACRSLSLAKMQPFAKKRERNRIRPENK